MHTDSFYCSCIPESQKFTREQYVDAENLSFSATTLDLSEITHQIQPHQDITFDNK